jgi:bifunctional non-homologous end joining protein LigD
VPKIAFEPCLPTRGTRVPPAPEWLHEIKHDGYRLIVHRDGARVRLFTRNGPDWTGRYPLKASMITSPRLTPIRYSIQ